MTENETIQDTPEQTETPTDSTMDIESVETETPEEEQEDELTIESVTMYLETDEGKRLLQPIMDRFYTKGLETWKQNNLEAVFSEHDRRMADPKEAKLYELEKAIAQEDHLDRVTNKVKSIKMLPIELVDAFANVDTTTAFRTIDRLVDHAKATIPVVVKGEIDSRFGDIKKG